MHLQGYACHIGLTKWSGAGWGEETGTCKEALSTWEEGRSGGSVWDPTQKQQQQIIHIFFSWIVSSFHVAALFWAFIKRFLSDVSSDRMLFLFKMETALNSLRKEEAQSAGRKEQGVTGRWNVQERSCRKTGRGSVAKPEGHNSAKARSLAGSTNPAHLPCGSPAWLPS